MTKRTKKQTKLSVYITDHYGTVRNFIRKLNEWAGMIVYDEDTEGSTRLRVYLRGEAEPFQKKSFRKFKILCDYVKERTGEDVDLTWIKPLQDEQPEPSAAPIMEPADQELPFCYEDHSTDFLGEMYEAFKQFSETMFNIFKNNLKTN